MIITRIHSGLGNQLFQMAIGLTYSNEPLLVDTHSYKYNFKIDTPRNCMIDKYNISYKEISFIKAFLYQGYGLPDKVRHVWRIIISIILKKRIINDNNYNKLDSLVEKQVYYLDGFFQNPSLFIDNRANLLKSFSLAQPSKLVTQTITSLQGKRTLLIHVRRGDYVTSKNTNTYHGVCDIHYYKEALDYMRSHIKESLCVVIATDDPVWCKEHIVPIIMYDEIIFLADKGLKDYEEIEVMRHLDNFIIANSSFSWWGAWLSETRGKIVVAPKKWYANERAQQHSKIIPPEWIRL